MHQTHRRAPVIEMPVHASAPQPALGTDAVSVVFTSFDATLEAARVGAELARALSVPLQLIHFRTVSPHVPVNEPGGSSPIETETFVARLRREGISAGLHVYLCRNAARAIVWAFNPHSLVVLGGRRRWWPTRVGRLRRALEAAGHFVVFVDPSAFKEPSHA
jgi:hypothetical protein